MTVSRRQLLSMLSTFVVPLWLAVPVASRAQETLAELTSQVEAAEAAFAQTLADRDFAAFQSFLADEAVFLDGGSEHRGKRAVAELWGPYFEGQKPPFSWRPGVVAVLESGRLALSTGPVFDPAGTRVSTFTSIWRRQASGEWRIVFDKGDVYRE